MNDDDLDNDRMRLIWTNVLECVDNASTDGLQAVREFAASKDDPEFELQMLFSVTTSVLASFFVRALGEDDTRTMISRILLDLELDAHAAATLDTELRRWLQPDGDA